MAKTLFLHQHSEVEGGHVSAVGRMLAHNYGMYYRGRQPVNHVFCSSLVWTTETAVALMTGCTAFDGAVVHHPIEGLGGKYSLRLLGEAELDDLVDGDLSRLPSNLRADQREGVISTFYSEAVEAVKRIFAVMEDGQLGVGIFHDPFISLAALNFGLQDARALIPMEYIVFTMDDNGDIVATWSQVG